MAPASGDSSATRGRDGPARSYPVYFVVFFPEPVSGQRLDDVLAALRHFVEEVASRHGGRATVLYGNRSRMGHGYPRGRL